MYADDFDVINLSGRDWRWLLDLLDNPNQPNQKMTAALEKYQNAKHDELFSRLKTNG